MSMWTSKLGERYPLVWIQEQDSESQAKLNGMRCDKSRSNDRCADCGAFGTAWASVTHGVFICIACADVHRSVGTHITKVKGCTGTYLWGPDELARMDEVGNVEAEKRYGSHKIDPSASKDTKQKYVVDKYDKKKFVSKETVESARQDSATSKPANHGGKMSTMGQAKLAPLESATSWAACAWQGQGEDDTWTAWPAKTLPARQTTQSSRRRWAEEEKKPSVSSCSWRAWPDTPVARGPSRGLPCRGQEIPDHIFAEILAELEENPTSKEPVKVQQGKEPLAKGSLQLQDFPSRPTSTSTSSSSRRSSNSSSSSSSSSRRSSNMLAKQADQRWTAIEFGVAFPATTRPPNGAELPSDGMPWRKGGEGKTGLAPSSDFFTSWGV